jgi:hypothetical protein
LSIFEINCEHWDPDIQQRAIEYLALLKSDSFGQIRAYSLDKMPPYSEEIQANNPLLRKIISLKQGTAAKDATINHAVKKLVEEEMFKTKSFMTDSRIKGNLNQIGKETVNLGGIDLIGMGDDDAQTAVSVGSKKSTNTMDLLGDDLLGDSVSTSGTSKDIKSHPLYSKC